VSTFFRTSQKVKATKVTYIADRKLTQEIRGLKFSAEPESPKGIVSKKEGIKR